MQFQSAPRPHARFNNFHGPKRQLVGHQVQPAWKPNAAAANRQAEASGSKIFLSQLPTDVGEKDVEELFRKTVGPVKDCFLIFNSQGNSKGMAVVSFAKTTDAASAKAKYHGKIVDGRKPLKIEIVTDEVPSATAGGAQPAASQPLTLLQRLGGLAAVTSPAPTAGPAPQARPLNHLLPTGAPRNHILVPKTRVPGRPFVPVPVSMPVMAPRRRTTVKKGPKRLQKKPLSAAELDQEMEEYRKDALGEVEMST
ncbi:hypothetical protein DFP72DRAFT_51299 [Ephemerocybe angulata]|uniref:RRM domain-containing protein n=1 Tax=Ephemerocybe angulata TaxID=980116 RepID=A0A8H6LWL2_9AGAR|nr:hypothetical protein DFP72DRAFT_51299 [Tulosesus angulatus]